MAMSVACFAGRCHGFFGALRNALFLSQKTQLLVTGLITNLSFCIGYLEICTHVIHSHTLKMVIDYKFLYKYVCEKSISHVYGTWDMVFRKTEPSRYICFCDPPICRVNLQKRAKNITFDVLASSRKRETSFHRGDRVIAYPSPGRGQLSAHRSSLTFTCT